MRMRLGVDDVIVIPDDGDPGLSYRTTQSFSAPAASSTTLSSCQWQGKILKPGMTVELLHTAATYNLPRVEFLTITTIHYSEKHGIELEGLRSRRHEAMGGVFDLKLNECCLILDICPGQHEDPLKCGTYRVPLSWVSQIRHMIFTATESPQMSYQIPFGLTPTNRQIRDKYQLVCRWVWTTIFPDDKSKSKEVGGTESELRRLMKAEVALDGTTINKPKTASSPKNPVHPGSLPKYTYLSGFCGAGGDAAGARAAGATVVGGVDFDQSAIKSFKINFPDAKAVFADMTIPISDHIGVFRPLLILHLSPPCQFWSVAHTTAGKDDDRNIAALFCVAKKLEELKPTYLTLENAFGLVCQHPVFFNALINMIMSQSYNVRWFKSCEMLNYGLCSKRKRLIIVAAKHGFPLPRFPQPTHAKVPDRDQLPWATVRDVIAQVLPQDPLHLPTVRNWSTPRPVMEREQIQCVITAGAKDSHPSGLRPFSHRELAMILGFPLDHQFVGKDIRRQIGNAIPAIVWQHFVWAIIDSHRRFEQGFIDVHGNEILTPGKRYQSMPPPSILPIAPSGTGPRSSASEPTVIVIDEEIDMVAKELIDLTTDEEEPATNFGSHRQFIDLTHLEDDDDSWIMV